MNEDMAMTEVFVMADGIVTVSEMTDSQQLGKV